MSSTESYPAPARTIPATSARDVLRQKADELFSISPDASVIEAIAEMANQRIGALLVTEDDHLRGIVSERDCAVRCILEGRDASTTRVAQIMTANVFTISPNTTLHHCMSEMTARRIRHLPVLDRGMLVGLISIGDVVREILDQQRHALEELERYVSGAPSLVAEVASGGE